MSSLLRDTAGLDCLSILKSVPYLCLVLKADAPRYTIVAASDAFVHATTTRHEEILGRGLFEVFPDNPAEPGATGVKNLSQSLERALKSRASDAMAIQRHDMCRYTVQERIFEPRWWNPVCSPVLGSDGRIAFIILSVDTVAAEGITGRTRAEAVRKVRRELEADLDAMSTLQEVGRLFIHEGNLESVLAAIVDAAIAISHADFGDVQLVDVTSSELRIAAQRGSPQDWLGFWEHAWKGNGVCGRAIERKERVIVEDIEHSPIFVGTPAMEILRKAGVRALQCTPVIGRTGKLLGTISTHYNTPHRPSTRVLRLLDLLACQTAGMIERVQAEQAMQAVSSELCRTLDTAATGLTHCSRDLRYLSANPAYAQWIGLPVDQIVGRSIVDVMGKEAFEVIRPRVERVLRGERVEYEDALPIGGVPKPIHVVYTPETRSSGDVVGWVASVTDISELRRAEDSLRAANAQLIAADHRKNEFLAMLGHELRNPLNPIRLTVTWMSRVASAEPAFRKGCEMIDRQITHMTRLIDDLLDASRITYGKIPLHKEAFDLTDVVQAAVREQRPLFAAEGVTLDLASPPTRLGAFGDPVRIAQVIDNLLVNARKFTERGGRVSVELRALEDGSALITVRDTGVGMDEKTLEMLFEPFAQATHSVGRSQGGLGLGLALVKGLVELHGGFVSAKSAGLGHGSEFQVRLPILARSSAEPSKEPAVAAPKVRSQRVLVVEDDVDAAESLKLLLEPNGHQVAVAHSGAEGLRQARTQKPEVVLCDIGLPGDMDGYAIARALRADPELRSSYLIAMTGYGQDEDRRLAKEAGFDAFLTKPTDPDELERLLAR
jgi:PAS domain S-box-containing protein